MKLRPGFLTLHLCVFVSKISQEILNRSTSFLMEGFPLPQGGNHSILTVIALG